MADAGGSGKRSGSGSKKIRTAIRKQGEGGTLPKAPKGLTANHPSLFGYHGGQGTALVTEAGKGPCGRVIFFGATASLELVRKHVPEGGKAWTIDGPFKRGDEMILLPHAEVPTWILRPRTLALKKTESKAPRAVTPAHGGLLQASAYTRARDLAGTWTREIPGMGLENLVIEFHEAKEDEILGVFVGLELGVYRFQKVQQNTVRLSLVVGQGAASKLYFRGKAIGVSVNIARHLINTPAGRLVPEAFAREVERYFSGFSTFECEVWRGARLQEERMGLLNAVGQGAENLPCYVRLRYRPKGHKGKHRVALIGKGITFDTGGLDLKPSDGMRLMKKDMGGAAAIVGFAAWLAAEQPPFPCDLHLPLAENAIGPGAVRPGDVMVARNGATVEMHNTDAEGRLVLADAMDVALSDEDSDSVSALIDVATLTGAIKVALGTRYAGLFANDDDLADLLQKGGHAMGDGSWRMPLVDEYQEQLRSTVADFTNCSASRFGGAITAALFLQRFCKGRPWAHLDIYAWAERPEGGLREEGGSGQGVQCLIGLAGSWKAGL